MSQDLDQVPPALAALGALTHRSRRRIAEELRTNSEGLTVDELSNRVELHPNAIRQHLRRLAQAGVVVATKDAPSGRGRPRMRYGLIDLDAPRVAAHQELVRMLVGVLRSTGATADDVEAFGREYGRSFHSEDDGLDRVKDVFGQLGFAPQEISSRRDREEGRLALRLDYCPFQEAVNAPGGEMICHLHRGLAQGIAERSCTAGRIVDLIVRDPINAGCRMIFAGDDAVADPGAPA